MSCEGIAMNVEVVVPTIACVRVLPACGWCCQDADTTCFVGQRGFALFGVGALSGSCFRLVPVKCTLLAGLGVNFSMYHRTYQQHWLCWPEVCSV